MWGECAFNTRELVGSNLHSYLDIMHTLHKNLILKLHYEESAMLTESIVTAYISMLVKRHLSLCFEDHILLNGAIVVNETKLGHPRSKGLTILGSTRQFENRKSRVS